LIDDDIDFRIFVKIAVMDFTIVNAETVEFHRKQLLDFLRPRFVDPNL